MGPPQSMAPSLVPASSVNLTDILLAGENALRDTARLVPSQMKLRAILNFAKASAFIFPANSFSISLAGFVTEDVLGST